MSEGVKGSWEREWGGREDEEKVEVTNDGRHELVPVKPAPPFQEGLDGRERTFVEYANPPVTASPWRGWTVRGRREEGWRTTMYVRSSATISLNIVYLWLPNPRIHRRTKIHVMQEGC